jgi:hypothetical protein
MQNRNTKRTKIITRRASKLSAHSEGALLKSEGETGSAKKGAVNMNSQTRMRTEKNHQQHAKQKYKTNQNHIGNSTNAKTMVAALNSRLHAT